MPRSPEPRPWPIEPGSFERLGPARSEATGHWELGLWAPRPERLTLLVGPGPAAVERFELGPDRFRHGASWSIALPGLEAPFVYAFEAPGAPGRRLLDPRAPAFSGTEIWGRRPATGLFSRALPEDDFDWQGVARPRIEATRRVIYELQLRGFTRGVGSGVVSPGTYAGLAEKIPYLLELGVTTVELLPIFEFDELEIGRTNPETGERLLNLWGYSPLSFFAPKAGWAATPGDARAELKALVRELHRVGLEVVLDVVFNHTGEKDRLPHQLYHLEPFAGRRAYHGEVGSRLDFTGCGNSLRGDSGPVADLVVDSLVHWATEYRVDGFRFDLAPVLARRRDRTIDAEAPLLRRIGEHPALRDRLLIAEPWDAAAGGYCLGRFGAWGPWREWNDRYRDDVRRFWAGQPGHSGRLATRLAGSSDHFADRRPSASVNYVTCHDGFTLADLVAFERKHNLANGEANRDGSSWNHAWNSGVEGPTDDPGIRRLRARRARSMLATLLLSQGTPMLLAGDERGRSQRGNNNAYCQDNEISWIDWRESRDVEGLVRFVRALLAWRRRLAVFGEDRFLEGESCDETPDVVWLVPYPEVDPWAKSNRTLLMHRRAASGEELLLAAYGGRAPADVVLPPPHGPGPWRRFLDTSRESPLDVLERAEPVLIEDLTAIEPMSVWAFVGDP